MSNFPVVSIIIPTFNRCKYLGVALDSILAQTFTEWECLVVDDGSTDAPANVMKDYCSKDDRIKYYKRADTHLKGPNGCRNYGLLKSKGSYVGFCDDDDFWLDDKLEKQLAIFKEHPDVGLVTGNIEYVNSDGKRTGRVIKQTGNHGDAFESLLFKNGLSMITPVLKREVFDKVGLFNTDFVIFEDWEYWRRVAYYYPFYALPDVLACVRKHDSNTSLIVTEAPFEQYARYRALTRALLKWGKHRFTKADRILINKVEAKRYVQLMHNHCPGFRRKIKLFLTILKFDLIEGLRFGYLYLKGIL